MKKFDKVSGIAAPLNITNIDTDMIIPKQFLKSIKRTGFGVNLFDEMRYDLEGNEINDFILNQDPYRKASVLVTGENFGCGSSREHAPWAIMDFGITCIIAPSFADIFYNNCFKNGILPVALPQDQVDELMEVAQSDNPDISADLESQTITAQNKQYKFEIDPFRKHCLINGLDDIGLTMEKSDHIDSYEQDLTQKRAWL